MNPDIADLRRDYTLQFLLEKDLASTPISQFTKWWGDVLKSEIVEPNAMTLATASSDGLPYARIVLLKGFDENGFVFYTNYTSYKALQMEENPKACLVFFWKEIERQVRVVGLVSKIPIKDSDEYFATRPVGSQIGAWASPQSQVIDSRDWLDKRNAVLTNEMKNSKIDRPPHWGGYIVKPVIVEFWQGRSSRLHDRLQYTLNENGDWKIERLAP